MDLKELPGVVGGRVGIEVGRGLPDDLDVVIGGAHAERKLWRVMEA